MTKLYELETTTTWTKLDTLAGATVTGTIELFNAGREGSNVILWTENAALPTADTFYRVLEKQKSAVVTLGTQDIWLRSEIASGKLVVSSLNNATITVKGTL